MKNLKNWCVSSKFLFLVLCSVSTVTGLFAQTPSISSFTPGAGPVGTEVTITGANFSTLAGNIVWFGAVQATVTLTSSIELTVTVPQGASYQVISVTNMDNGLTAYSKKPFIVTFPGAPIIDTTAFTPKVDFLTAGGAWSNSVAIGDIDGDGKPDLAVTNYNTNKVSLFRNVSITGIINPASFESKVDFTTGSGPYNVVIGDMDGDGKADLAVSNWLGNSVSVFRNTGNTGPFNGGSLESRIDFVTGTNPYCVALGDLNEDGKPDLVVSNYTSNTISVLANISNAGTINSGSFKPKVDFTAGTGPRYITIGDIDGDGKPDLAYTVSGNFLSILRNTSIPDSIYSGSFSAPANFPSGTTPYGLAIGDIDGDGKQDLIVANGSNSSVSVYMNTSTPGVITPGSLASRVDFSTGTSPQNVSISDLNGDGKPDLAVENANSNSISVLRNTSIPGIINAGSFANKVNFSTGAGPYSVAVGDLDGDGKPDLTAINATANSISVLWNNISPLTAATLMTQMIFNITSNSATAGSLILSDGGAAITSRGVCWSTISNPTLSDSYFVEGTGVGGFPSNISGLLPITTYYVRSFAVNSSGTAYGNELSFTTDTAVIPGTAASNSTICSGTSASMTLTGYSGNIQWQQSSDGITNWFDVLDGTGGNSDNYITGNLDATTYYRVAINQPGFSDVYSNTIIVTVNPNPDVAGTVTGQASVCQAQAAVIYSVPAIANATSYIWTLPTGASGTSTTNSVSVDYGSSAVSGNISVKGNNSCGDGTASTLAVTVNPLPDVAGILSGLVTVCQGQNAVIYTVPAIANATSYIWTLPAGATGVSTTNSITIDYGTFAISGSISVKGNNSCGDGISSFLTITVNPLPDVAGSITGQAAVCQGQNSVIYTVPAIANATSYIWTLPAGVTGLSTTNSISVDYGVSAVSGNITVKGSNSCGDGSSSSLAVTVNPFPDMAGAITGLATVCQTQSLVIYSVPVITNATSYIWTLPTGATGTSATNSISVNYNITAVSGNLSVLGTNSCGSGASSIIPITVNVKPVTPVATFDGTILHSNALEGNQWFDQNGIIAGAVNQDYNVTMDGNYFDIVSLMGCSSDQSNTITRTSPCEAHFDYLWNSSTGFTNFTDLSTGSPSGWSWNFGDGTSSKLKNPIHNYVKDGVYTVTLTMLNEQTSCISSVSREVMSGSGITCEADFEMNINSGTGLALFSSTSLNATDYYWDFGDGEFAVDSVTEHLYVNPGIYHVCLTIWNNANGCQSVVCKNIIYIPEGEKYINADFIFFTNPNDNTVILNDLSSSNTTDWYWTMCDGKVSTEKNPVYTYSKPGMYNICLTVYDQVNFLSGSVCKQVQVGTIPCNIGSDFTYFINPAELEVTFLSLAQGSVDNYSWDFGDGSSSTMENSSHQYLSPGYYEVKLSVRNSVNNCVDESSVFIQVGIVDCRAGYTYRVNPADNSVNFTDNSKGLIEYYYWDFSNGIFSVESDPVQIFDENGIYMVGQFVIDNTGSCIDYIVQPVQVGEVDCSADFISYIDSSDFTAYFTNKNLGVSTALLWSFGDGSFSTQENPVHKFPGEGIYSAGLNTYDFNSACMDYHEEMLLIGGIGIDCSADFNYRVDPLNAEVTFIDNSIGVIVGYIWNFGDINAENSDEMNPVYSYSKGGYYNVCLSVTNSDGIKNMACKWILIDGFTGNNCRANFMFTIDSAALTAKFVDNSYGEPDKYTWDFGDNKDDSVSVAQNPSHTYSQNGYYLVQLKVENSSSGCVSSEYKLLNIADNQVLKAAFGYEAKEPDKKFAGYPVDLVSASSGDGATVEWDFGDKQLKKGFKYVMDSTSRMVTHYYEKPGKYEVCLRISDPVRKISDIYCNFVETKNPVNVEETDLSELILTIYPNPLIDYTNINYSIVKPGYIEIAVFDELGRRVETLVKSEQESGNYQITWHTSSMSTGVYHLKMITKGEIITRQIVISR